MTLPAWTVSDIFNEVSGFLNQDAVKAMVIAIIAIGLAERIIAFARHATRTGD